jgi:hypothetical protein
MNLKIKVQEYAIKTVKHSNFVHKLKKTLHDIK